MKNGCCQKLAVYSPLLLRLAAGSLFVFAGVGKLQKGTEATLAMVASMSPSWLPEVVGTAYGYILPYLELVAGVMLIVGLFTPVAAAVCGLMAITFLIGAGVWTQTAMPSWNWLLLATCLHLYAHGSGECSVDDMMAKKR